MLVFGRVVGVVILIWAALYGAWWILVPLGLLLVVYFKLYELIFIGFCFDVYYAPELVWPFYTTLAVMSVCGGMSIRPWLLNPKETQ